MFGNKGFSPYGIYGLGTAAKSGINWSSLLTNTQKTLGIINQAIPAFYQVKPIFSNMKTMFRVVNEINRDDSKNTNNINTSTPKNNSVYDYKETNTNVNDNNDGPNFFV